MYIYDYWDTGNKDFYDVYDFTGSDPTATYVQHPSGWNSNSKAFSPIDGDSPPWHTVSVRSRNKAPFPDQRVAGENPENYPTGDIWNGYRVSHNVSNTKQSQIEAQYCANDLNVRFCTGANTVAVDDILSDPKSYTWEGTEEASSTESPGQENHNVWMSNIPVAWPITETEVVVRLSALMALKKEGSESSGKNYRYMNPMVENEDGSFSGFNSVRFMNKEGMSIDFELEHPSLPESFGGTSVFQLAFDFTEGNTPSETGVRGLPQDYFEPVGAESWNDYFLGLNEFDGKKRVFGDMVVFSVKNKEQFLGFSSYGIPIMENIGDLFTLPENELVPAWTLDSQGRSIIQYVSRLPKTNSPFVADPDFNPDKEIYTYYWPMKEPFTGATDASGVVLSDSESEYDIDHNPFYYGLSKYIAPMRQKAKTKGDEITRWMLGDTGSPSWVKTEDHGWVFIGTWRGGMHNAYTTIGSQTAPVTNGGQVNYLEKNTNPFGEINQIWGSSLKYVDLSQTIKTYDISKKTTTNETILPSQSSFETYECSVQQPWNNKTEKIASVVGNASQVSIGISADIQSFYESKNLANASLDYPALEFDRRSSMGLISVGKGYAISTEGYIGDGELAGPSIDDNGDGIDDRVFNEKETLVAAPYIDYIRGTPYGGEPANSRDLYLGNDSFIQWNNILSYTLKNQTRATVAPIPPHKRTVQVLIKRTSGEETTYFNYPMFNQNKHHSHKLGALAFNGSDYKTGQDTLPFLVSTVCWTTPSSETNSAPKSYPLNELSSADTFNRPYTENGGLIDSTRSFKYDTRVGLHNQTSPEWQMKNGPHGAAIYPIGTGVNAPCVRWPSVGTETDAVDNVSLAEYNGSADPSTMKDPFATSRMITYQIATEPVERVRATIKSLYSANLLNAYSGSFITSNARIVAGVGGSMYDLIESRESKTATAALATMSGRFVDYTVDSGNVIDMFTSPFVGKCGLYTRSPGPVNNFSIGTQGFSSFVIEAGINVPVQDAAALHIGDGLAEGEDTGSAEISRYITEANSLSYEGIASLPIDYSALSWKDSDPSNAWYEDYQNLNSGSPFDAEMGELQAGDQLVLRVRVSGLKDAVEKEYLISDLIPSSKPVSRGYKIGLFKETEITPFVEWFTNEVTVDGDNNESIIVSLAELGFDETSTDPVILRARISPLDGEEYDPPLGYQFSYKTNDFDFETTEFKPLMLNLQPFDADSSSAVSFDGGSSSPSSGFVSLNVRNVNAGDILEMRPNIAYPHDDISINDQYPVTINFIE